MSDEHVTIDDILPRVEQLAGADRVVTELPGGLTNTNYKVVVGGRSYVVRVSSKDAGLLAIDRENEYSQLGGGGRGGRRRRRRRLPARARRARARLHRGLDDERRGSAPRRPPARGRRA